MLQYHHHHPYLHHHQHHHIYHQPDKKTPLLLGPGVHSNKSVEEVLNHVRSQSQSISRNHSSFFHGSPKITNNSKLQVLFGTRSKKCRKSLWKLALNNNHHHHCHLHHPHSHNHHYPSRCQGRQTAEHTHGHKCTQTPLSVLSSSRGACFGIF